MIRTASFPIWRTDPAGISTLGAQDWRFAGVWASILPALIGLLLLCIGNPFGLLTIRLADDVSTLGTVLAYGGLFAWAGVLLGAYLFQNAMSRGWGGWGVALMLGLLLSAFGSVPFYLARHSLYLNDEFTIAFVFFCLHGIATSALGWLILRRQHPLAFVSTK